MADQKPNSQTQINDPLNYVEPYWSSKPIHAYFLEVIRDGEIIETINIDKKPYYVLGRHIQCDIQIDSPSASRKHAVLQHKDTGSIYIYDLGSTHGTFVNRKIIPPLKYIELHIGDQFRLGVSSKSYILNGPEELQQNEQDNIVAANLEPQKRAKPELSKEAKEEIFKKRVEHIQKLHEEREKNKLKIKHDETGISWGIDDEDIENQENYKEDESDSENENENMDLSQPASELLKNTIWTEKQKQILLKMDDCEKKLNKLLKEKDNFIKSAETNFEETQNYDKKLESLEERIGKLKKNLSELKENLKNTLEKKVKTNETKEKNKYEAYVDEEDNFYDQTHKNKILESQNKEKTEKISETYESLKSKLEKLVRERVNLMQELMEKPSKNDTKPVEIDPLDQFMHNTEQNLAENDRERITKKITEISDEIDKITHMLKFVTPTFATMQSSKPDLNVPKPNEIAVSDKKEEKKKSIKTTMSLTETMQRIEEIKREREKKEQERLKKEMDLEKLGEMPENYTAQDNIQITENLPPEPKKLNEPIISINPENIENEKLEPSNYFAEIIKNANKEEINLDDYKIIKQRYEEYNKRKSELSSQKIINPNEKKYGLEHFFAEPDKTQGGMNELFEYKRPMQSSGIVDPISKKVRRVQGPTPKPQPRNISETQEEKSQEFVEELPGKFGTEENLDVIKKPHE